jgi:hypothetical protein
MSLALLYQLNLDEASPVVAPTIDTADVSIGGSEVTIIFSDVVTIGAGGSAGFYFETLTGDVSLTYSLGDPDAVLFFTTSRVIEAGEPITLAYVQPGDGIENTSGVDLDSFSGQSVTNSSVIDASGGNSYTLIYYIDRTIGSGETVTLDYTQPGNGVEDISRNDLATFTGESVTNNSNQ